MRILHVVRRFGGTPAKAPPLEKLEVSDRTQAAVVAVHRRLLE